ncbi:ethanolamine kinase 1 [Microplitis demolitor]|uniref:ethanolamine kinase 1 n=1 Tax=Microplitis demolitor TaxID=69319 RepID=UPI00235B61DE|nr:ethanolamine kinase 1 [Microplitis demolitor]
MYTFVKYNNCGEMDSLQMKNEVHIDLTIDENDYQDDIKQIVDILRKHWPKDQLEFKIFTNGITNKLIGVYYPGHYNEMLLVRIYGNKTDLLINRKDEVKNIRVLHKAGHTHSLYATFNNGLVYEFLNGEVLTPETIINPDIYWLVAKRLAQMHLLNPREYLSDYGGEGPREPIIWKKTEKFMELMPRSFDDDLKQARFEKMIKPFQVLEEEYKLLKDNLIKLDSPIVYSHNDLLLTNILYDKNVNTVTFIDFEYTGFNYQAFDIANHFAEFAGVENINYDLYPDEIFQRSWLRLYLQAYNKSSSVSEDQVTKLFKEIEKFILLTHFFWGCWSLIQYQHSTIDFDFLEFAAIRFNEYFKRKNLNNGIFELTTQL